ncbi:hypothetical protein AMELA_G00136550 [Ameiurus melas]|uniref:Large ribosomal subunit protein mL54 n=1 Tax=Ameiurus melas TaxID=219545 RepID=A0A7J6AJS5_AMEME|nr:hypothetical protein AMELA_G00136550 [Ameiurus melas]
MGFVEDGGKDRSVWSIVRSRKRGREKKRTFNTEETDSEESVSLATKQEEEHKVIIKLSQERCTFAAKGKGKGMVKDVLKGPEVCKDPVRLTSHAVGVNIYKQGEDPPLKPQEEYPAWLFELDLGPPKKLQELDTESHEYWKRLRKEHIWRFNKLHKGKKI